MKMQCEISGSEFIVSEPDLELLRKLSPVLGGERCELPVPGICPDERKRLRLAFRNERFLYHRKCELSGERIICSYSPDKDCTVYSKKAWWSDAWDARSYGREVDFSRPFFEQFAELQREAPRIALVTSPDADDNNCPYINFAGSSKNCHMLFDSDFCEDSCYSNELKHSRDCVDCSYVHSSELCYECVDCSNCYQLLYSQDCDSCSDSYFLHGCIGCRNCLMCTNLVQKQYYVENKPYTKAQYLKKLEELNIAKRDVRDSLHERFLEFHLKYPKKYCRVLKSENSYGDYLRNVKNCTQCFNVGDAEDLRYCDSVYAAKDCMDVSSFGERIECVYNSGTIGIDCFSILMSFVVVGNCREIIYCDNCRQARTSFGCCGLRQNEYCILNKQYSRDEYQRLALKLARHMQETGEWGKFFPLELSPYGYNETKAQESFPLSKEEALACGANWSDYEPPLPEVASIDISEFEQLLRKDGGDLSQAIRSSESGRPFRLTSAELRFYQKLQIAVPRLHPDERHRRRIALRNPQRLWTRECAKTGEKICTSYSPGRREIVYCEKAYQEALL